MPRSRNGSRRPELLLGRLGQRLGDLGAAVALRPRPSLALGGGGGEFGTGQPARLVLVRLSELGRGPRRPLVERQLAVTIGVFQDNDAALRSGLEGVAFARLIIQVLANPNTTAIIKTEGKRLHHRRLRRKLGDSEPLRQRHARSSLIGRVGGFFLGKSR